MTNKPLYLRKLKDGKWIVLALDSEALVIDEDLAESFLQGTSINEKCNDETIEIFRQSGFYNNEQNASAVIPEEKDNKKWKTARYALLIGGVLALLITIFLTLATGIPIGSMIIPPKIDLWRSISFAIAFAATTTIIHELFHIIYSRNWKNLSRSFHISLKKSVVTVSMTYIWVWSLLARVCAVLAGIIWDVILLAVFSISRLLFDNWIVLSAISILWVRVLWHLRFHKNCDGRLFAMLLLDTPLIDDMEEYADNAVYKKTVFIWKILNYVGKIVNLAIVVFWIIPIIVNIFICFFQI